MGSLTKEAVTVATEGVARPAGNSLDETGPLSPTGASSDASASSPARSHGMKLRTKKARIRELGIQTRNDLRFRVRDDWDWPLPNTPQADGTDRDWSGRVLEDTRYVEREPGSEQSDDGSDQSDAIGDEVDFHSPDAFDDVRQKVIEHRDKRKERRRRRFLNELKSNEGLRIFEQRRNAWTGTKLAPGAAVRAATSESTSESSEEEQQQPPTPGAVLERDLAPHVRSDTTPYNLNISGGVDGDSDNDNDAVATADKPVRSAALLDPDLTAFVPVPVPIISPDNEIRQQVSPHAYDKIYRTVVVQGTSPSIPINLADMTRAIVAGWKSDDEWPPRQVQPLEPLAGSRRKGSRVAAAAVGGGAHSAARQGSSWLKKVLRITAPKDEASSLVP